MTEQELWREKVYHPENFTPVSTLDEDGQLMVGFTDEELEQLEAEERLLEITSCEHVSDQGAARGWGTDRCVKCGDQL